MEVDKIAFLAKKNWVLRCDIYSSDQSTRQWCGGGGGGSNGVGIGVGKGEGGGGGKGMGMGGGSGKGGSRL